MKEVKDKTRRHRTARVAAGFVGLVFALLAAAIPIGATLTFYVGPAQDDMHAQHVLIGYAAYWFTIASVCVFCILRSAVLVRYALRDQIHSASE